MVIEDDAEILDLYREFLTEAGYTVSLYRHPDPALEALRHSPPNVVILDWLIGDMELGYDVVRSLADEPAAPRVALVVVTAAVHHVQRVASELAALGIPVLFKPFYIDELRLILESLLTDSSGQILTVGPPE